MGGLVSRLRRESKRGQQSTNEAVAMAVEQAVQPATAVASPSYHTHVSCTT